MLFKESRGIGEIVLGKVQDYSDWFDPGFVNAMHNSFFLPFCTMCARQKVMWGMITDHHRNLRGIYKVEMLPIVSIYPWPVQTNRDTCVAAILGL